MTHSLMKGMPCVPTIKTQVIVVRDMDEHGKKLEDLDDHVTQINVKLAVLADRETRELVMAKSMSMKVAATISTIVSAVVAGLVGVFGAGE